MRGLTLVAFLFLALLSALFLDLLDGLLLLAEVVVRPDPRFLPVPVRERGRLLLRGQLIEYVVEGCFLMMLSLHALFYLKSQTFKFSDS